VNPPPEPQLAAGGLPALPRLPADPITAALEIFLAVLRLPHCGQACTASDSANETVFSNSLLQF